PAPEQPGARLAETVARQLRRASAQYVPAVGALGYVRADLRSALLADHEQIGARGHRVILGGPANADCGGSGPPVDSAGTGAAIESSMSSPRSAVALWAPGRVDTSDCQRKPIDATRLREEALHPRLRPPRLVPEEVLRDRGRARPGADRDDRRRQAPHLRGYAACGGRRSGS